MKIYESEVCVVGAGPSGLAASIGLTLANVPFVLVDADKGPVAESRALAIHSGGTEVLDELGVAEELVAEGLKVRTFRIYARRRMLTTIPWDSVASPFPFILFVPQHTTETILLRRLAQLGAEPLFEHAVTGVKAVSGGYEVVGDGFAVRTSYVVGADGLGSTVRRELGITLPAKTYATAFLVVMTLIGLVESWWGLLAIPGAVLIGFGFAGASLGATTFMRSFMDFDFINIAIIPMFLFSATFFPLSRYPDALQWVVQATPLYQGVALERGLILGSPSWAMLGHAAYLAVMGWAGLRLATKRLGGLLQP